MEWCENEILKVHGIEPHLVEQPLSELLVDMVGAGASVDLLTEHFEVIELGPGDHLVHSHGHDRSLHFVESGMLTVYAEEEDITVRLRRATTGALLGVAAFFRRHEFETLESIRADSEARVHRLSRSAFDDLAAQHPDIAMALQSYALEVLADRYAANLALFERTLTEER